MALLSEKDLGRQVDRYEDLTEAVNMHREVLMRLLKSDPERWIALGNLEDALSEQAEASDQSLNTDGSLPS